MTFRELLILIQKDLKNHGGKGVIRSLLVFFFNMPFRLVLNYRLGFFLAKRRNVLNNLLIIILKKHQLKKRSCDISYHAKIGQNIKFPHPLSIVIGEDVDIGDDVIIWQEVTIGSHGRKESKMEYPVIKQGVKLFSGCKVIGRATIGIGAVVGANAVVLIDVPDYHTAVGIPAISKMKSNEQDA